MVGLALSHRPRENRLPWVVFPWAVPFRACPDDLSSRSGPRRENWRGDPVMATAPSVWAEPRAACQRFLLRSVHWNIYEALLKELGQRPFRLTFDRGDLELMELPAEQRLYVKLIDKLVRTLGEVTGTPPRCGRRLASTGTASNAGWNPIATTTSPSTCRAGSNASSTPTTTCHPNW